MEVDMTVHYWALNFSMALDLQGPCSVYALFEAISRDKRGWRNTPECSDTVVGMVTVGLFQTPAPGSVTAQLLIVQIVLAL